jgi:hypothetical protein
MKKRHEEISLHYVDDLVPVTPIKINTWYSKWSAISSILIFIMSLVIGFRSDLFDLIYQWDYLISIGGLFILFLASSWYSFLSGIPGRINEKTRGLVFTILLIYCVSQLIYSGYFSNLILVPHLHTSGQILKEGLICSSLIIIFSFIPNVFLLFILNKLESLNIKVSVFLAMFGTLSIGMLILQFHCPIDYVIHRILGHGFFVLSGISLLYPLYQRLFTFFRLLNDN